jgi:hypothetical protein
MNIEEDILILKNKLLKMPTIWEAKNAILELKEVDYNWRQMEWIGWYFEYKAKQILIDDFRSGEKFNNISFDLKRNINWDLKAKAIKSDDHKVILNDKNAMELSIKKNKYHGEIIALLDVEYNDKDRTFQKWHTELKGGKSDYEIEREKRTSISRYRKTNAVLNEILLIIIEEKTCTTY